MAIDIDYKIFISGSLLRNFGDVFLCVWGVFTLIREIAKMYISLNPILLQDLPISIQLAFKTVCTIYCHCLLSILDLGEVREWSKTINLHINL